MSLINYICALNSSCAFSTHTHTHTHRKPLCFSLWQNHRERQTSTSYTLAQVCPTRATVSPQGMLGNVRRRLWLSQLNGRGTVGTRYAYTGRLLHFLRGTGRHPQHRTAWSQMSKAKVEKVSIQPKLKIKLRMRPLRPKKSQV